MLINQKQTQIQTNSLYLLTKHSQIHEYSDMYLQTSFFQNILSKTKGFLSLVGLLMFITFIGNCLILPQNIFIFPLSEMLNYNMNNTIINPQASLKTFVFQREDTQQSIIVEQQLDLQPPFINLSYLFSLHCPLAQNKVSIYDPAISRFVLLTKIGSENGYLPKAYLQPTFILIRYIGKIDYTGQSDSIDSNLENQSRNEKKDNRSKERTIAEVIQLIKKWRDLHMHGHKALKRRLNLQDAAKIVGISKKSLDDYYCQLRLGQLYNFNFFNNLSQKMGVLRSYVKNYRPERQTKRRQNQKHPKNLRIIEQFDLQTKKLKEFEFQMQKQEQQLPNPIIARTQSQRQYNSENRMQQQPSNPFEQVSQSSPIYKQLFSLENQFFKGFDMALDNQGDPYFDVDRDFRKKDFILDSDSFLLFD